MATPIQLLFNRTALKRNHILTNDLDKISQIQPDDFAQIQKLAQRLANPQGEVVDPLLLLAMGLIQTWFRQHCLRLDCSFEKWLAVVQKQVPLQEIERTLHIFRAQFRTAENSTTSVAEPPSEAEWVDLWILYQLNHNRTLQPLKAWIDDSELVSSSAYPLLMAATRDFLAAQPSEKDHSGRLSMLAPFEQFPDSLDDQLQFIGTSLPSEWQPDVQPWVLRAQGLLHEKQRHHERLHFQPDNGLPAHVSAMSFADGNYEPEAFTADKSWMPQVVMVAKNAYVWLHQLSERFQTPITHLDQIPDPALDELAHWGFNALWLIGVWERSPASKTIKQRCGQADAAGSAYALMDYAIAENLGGTRAFEDLERRCWHRGIRLASDMVPNHTALDSKWVQKHPDWFIQSEQPPYPNYRFASQPVYEDASIAIRIEDGYYDRSDAAVVFQRLDKQSGHIRYLYHGNDGTHMPWNDTAQLDYLQAEVREAVIQTILHVARLFPIIRFDAAMTLAKRHFSRLWYPQPGQGGDIPSRSLFALEAEAFDRLMPHEFWREVVDRVQAEVPNTLLLAEAFWLMEGYFVRSLGMHRVYNSAFMHMLKNEDHAAFRQTLCNTLAFDPRVLMRFVNFMSNPDEETARGQFDSGDKYFAVCTLLATLPGLPMFGHGQFEGLHEKYGMEFTQPKWQEQRDSELIQRHERFICPLLKERARFSEVSYFQLYEAHDLHGRVVEPVVAFSNGGPGQAVLVLVNNSPEQVSGTLQKSVPMKAAGPCGEGAIHLIEGLGLDLTMPYLTFSDHFSGLVYLRSLESLKTEGFTFQLEAYQAQVFWHFQQHAAEDWAELCSFLTGRGVTDFESVRADLHLQPVHRAWRQFWHADHLRTYLDNQLKPREREYLLDQFQADHLAFLDAICRLQAWQVNLQPISAAFRQNLNSSGKKQVPRPDVAPLSDAQVQGLQDFLSCALSGLQELSKDHHAQNLFNDLQLAYPSQKVLLALGLTLAQAESLLKAVMEQTPPSPEQDQTI
ncbi:MAG: hypothetical protein H6510_07570 [Acidobacteria bacterium]|nr:hypothetical protein [Acidobacteriota bacterium]MCB9397656.1 hypothetical protein [Acidobacteriota bacterium]